MVGGAFQSSVSKKNENEPKNPRKKLKRKKKKSKKSNTNIQKKLSSSVNSDEKTPSIPKKCKKPKLKDANGKLIKKTDHIHETKGQSKALRYLRTWKEENSIWKFEKCRQIWLLHNCYDDKKMDDKHFDIFLEYLAGIQGKSKEMALENALKNIKVTKKWKELKGTLTPDEIKDKVGHPEPSKIMKRRSKEIKILLSESNSKDESDSSSSEEEEDESSTKNKSAEENTKDLEEPPKKKQKTAVESDENSDSSSDDDESD